MASTRQGEASGGAALQQHGHTSGPQSCEEVILLSKALVLVSTRPPPLASKEEGALQAWCTGARTAPNTVLREVGVGKGVAAAGAPELRPRSRAGQIRELRSQPQSF